MDGDRTEVKGKDGRMDIQMEDGQRARWMNNKTNKENI